MSVTSNTELVAPSTGGRNIQGTPNATSDNAIVSSTVYLSSLILDNSNNAAASYLKLYDHASPTVGTTAPDWVFRANAGEILRITFQKSRPKFTTALSLCCVTAGGTAGSTSPTSTVSLGITTQTSEDAS